MWCCRRWRRSRRERPTKIACRRLRLAGDSSPQLDWLAADGGESVVDEWGDEFWQPNWNIDVQKETLHYKANKDVIAEFAESIRN